METIDGFNQNLITQSKACLIVVMLEKVNIQNSYLLTSCCSSALLALFMKDTMKKYRH